MKKIFIIAVLLCVAENVISQTHRLRFKYLLTQRRLQRLATRTTPIFLMDGRTVTQYQICNSTRLKVDITNTNGLLIIVPWQITSSPANCSAGNIVNPGTQLPLSMQLPPRRTAGDPTVSVPVHYRTWIIGANTFGLKLRPGVKDYNGKTYERTATAGSFNLGLSAGYSFGWTRFTVRSGNSFSLTPGFALGFSSANLSKEILSKNVDASASTSNLILSPAGSLIVARNDIGLIFTYGIDHMSGKNSDAWAYQNKRFFGIGVSASFKL
jgi:hypothetical protein